MNRIALFLGLACAGLAQATVTAPAVPTLRPGPDQTVAAHVAAEALGRYHYRRVAIDDALSERVFDRYLKALDAERLFFTQADIDQWQSVRTRIDDGMLKGDLSIPYAMFNLYLRRASERYSHARSLLKGEFDFRRPETYRYARQDEPWPKTEAEARELWRKRVKNDWLQLKISRKDGQGVAEILDKRYENYLKRIARMKGADAFQVFMNACTEAVEPHTGYMGPRASEDFGIAMRLSLVGIGAVLQEKDDHATIKDLVPGSPAALSGQLSIGDRIVSVAQGDSGTPVDVVGWRLDDTVTLIRGAADTVVRLEILPAGAAPDARPRPVSLVRKKVTLEEQAAKKSVLTVGSGNDVRRIGVVALPGFYEDFEARRRGDRDFRSASRDVARLLGELKADKVDAVLIDLRNNGGGSLTEAVDLTGLFIDSGPIVQHRDALGRITVGADTHAGTAWDGPLGVLINRASASASEIFAAAIQDYGRGVVIGDNSFGKGTVQSVVSLDEAIGRKDTRLGDLRLTIAQFYRIDGGTTQLRGVQPDIRLPSFIDGARFGESSFDNALPWGRIPAADYRRVDNLDDLLPTLRQRHTTRIAGDTDYQALLREIADAEGLRRKKEVSLDETERRKEKAAIEARGMAHRKPADDKAADKVPADPADEDAETPTKDVKDVVLLEAAAILGDHTELLGLRRRVAAREH